MEDKSSNVRKAAMQLVMTLLQYNPFGPVLDEPRLVATLAAHAAKLQARQRCCILTSFRPLRVQHKWRNGGFQHVDDLQGGVFSCGRMQPSQWQIGSCACWPLGHACSPGLLPGSICGTAPR